MVLLPPNLGAGVPVASPKADSSVDCANGCWTPVPLGTGSFVYQSGLYVILAVAFASSFNVTTSGTVFATFGEYPTGPSVAQSSGDLSIPAHANATARLKVSGVKVESDYFLTYFAADSAGKNISKTTAEWVHVVEQSPLQGPEPLSMVTSLFCNFTCAELSARPEILVTYKNTLNVSFPAVTMHGVIHCGNAGNNETISAVFQAGQSLTFPFYVGGLSAGDYCLSTFATMINGTALSRTSRVYFQVVSNGSLYIGETTDLTVVKAPALSTSPFQRAVQTTYLNSLNFSINAVVWGVFRNSLGQSVSYSTTTIIPPPGGNLTAYNFIFGLPPGTYSATIFATSSSFVAISNSTTFTFTIPSL